VKLVFDDGHDSGLYSWKYLRELGEGYALNWAKYQQRVHGSPIRKSCEGAEGDRSR
jgi:DUF971 family protein